MVFDNQVTIKIKRLIPEARIPKYEHFDDSGADLVAVDDYQLNPLERVAVATGIAVEIPLGYEIQIRPRSGLALKHGITVLNTPGTVDAGYRGEIKVILINLGSQTFYISQGQKIAQMVIAPVVRGTFTEVTILNESERGSGGFGSTGISVNS
jgi:dUTP pyrophosphatase